MISFWLNYSTELNFWFDIVVELRLNFSQAKPNLNWLKERLSSLSLGSNLTFSSPIKLELARVQEWLNLNPPLVSICINKLISYHVFDDVILYFNFNLNTLSLFISINTYLTVYTWSIIVIRFTNIN